MRDWANNVRWLAVLAWIGLALAGGNYAHATLNPESTPSHTHAAQDAHDHSHAGADCCDIESGDTLHCGASILALCQATVFKQPEYSDRFESLPFKTAASSDCLLEPPPPRLSA